MPTHFINGRPIDLDAFHLTKAPAQPRGRDLAWRVTRAQYFRACELVAQVRETKEGTDLYQALVDDLKSIPGYPHDVDQERDTLYFVITDTQVS